MRRLSQIVVLLLLVGKISAQTSPHGTIKFDCSDCHVSTSWKEIPAQKNFKHESTKFVLVGQHKNVDCKLCHSTLKFNEAKEECVSCHKDIHKNTVSKDCSNCHTPNTWLIKNITDIHQRSRFPLLGQHAKADCQQCHSLYSELNFEPIGVKCYDCHKQNYAATQSPNHSVSGFSTDCESCHNFTDALWGYASFAHDFFPLVGGHKISTCKSCHATDGTYTGLSKDCYSCHKPNFDQTTNPSHIAATFSTDCATCHTINGWKPSSFNHTQYFTLVGAHLQLDCNKCHSVSYKNTPTDCYGCHKTTFEGTTNPNHVTSKFPTDCTKCHSTSAWIPSTFSHAATQFPLTGAHTSVDCAKCHASGYVNTPTDCYSCHKTNYDNTTNPNHVTSQFPTDCKQCHSTSGWKPATFEHSTTQFPLTGAHLSVACNQCHASGYVNTPKDCYSCHKTNFDNTTNPNHVTANFPTDCTKCHSTSAWKPATFDHATTQFPLTGAHTSVDCAKCHASGYTNTPTDCYSCHKTNYDNTTNPNHKALGFQTACQDCHSTTKWAGATFDHDGKYFPIYSGQHRGEWSVCTDCHTNPSNYKVFSCINCHEHNNKSEVDKDHQGVGGYSYDSQACYRCHPKGEEDKAFNHSNSRLPLTGSHLTIPCESCHLPTITTALSPDCSSCHQNSFANSASPNHQQLGLSTDCKACHTSNGWKPSSFNHATTAFQLTGKHTTAVCSGCHKGKTVGTSQVCNDCHQVDFANSVSPNHTATGLNTDCKTCHTADGWKPSSFSHTATNFLLAGKHTTTACADCHKGKTAGTSQICYDCHQPSFVNSVNPNHQTLSLSTDCKTCHTSDGWKPSSFNHTTTAFQLTGKHTSVLCSDCHKAKAAGTSQICNDCHQQSFVNSVNPNHQATGISTDCKSCHTSVGWTPSSFSHTATNFQLTGGHTKAACTDCHKGITTGTSQICYDCHQTSFSNSVNPNHQSLGLSTDCKTCHSSIAWIPSSFDHATTSFQLTGGHSIAACSDCHKGKTTGTDTQCFACHKTDYDGVLDPNHLTAKFSTDCATCHSTTAWTPSTFNHANTKFPITGAHTRATCVQCHASGYTNTPTDCYSCHKTKFDASTNPPHLSAQFPHDCETCHTQSAWTPSTFNHDAKYFPIYSGEHNGEWNLCSDCHTSSSNYKAFSCINCHEHNNKAAVDKDHDGVKDYSYVSSECYRCHPKGKDLFQIKSYIKTIDK